MLDESRCKSSIPEEGFYVRVVGPYLQTALSRTIVVGRCCRQSRFRRLLRTGNEGEVAMPAAQSKQELEAVALKEFAKLLGALGGLDEVLAVTPDRGGTSIKDVVAHRSHWIDLFLGWYHDGLAGKQVFFPAEGYKWNELKRYNADLRATQTELDWDSAVGGLGSAHRRLMAFIEVHTDDELYGGPMVGAKNQWTPGRWAEASGPSHYRSAAKFVRSQIRDLAEQST